MGDVPMPAAVLLDCTDYPVVRLYPERVVDMAAFDALVTAWDEMVARGPAFAVISFGDHPEEEPGDVKRSRIQFFKMNRDVFRDRCAAIVNVEPDAALRQSRDREADAARRNLGFNIILTPDETAALAAAWSALGERAA